MRNALALLVVSLAAAPAARAQVISGALLESGSRAPLPGGVVTLLDADSAATARIETDSAGAFVFSLPRAGSYRLRAEQLGFRATTSPSLTLGSRDTLQVEFALARDAVLLDPLTVTGRSRRLTPAVRRFYERVELGGAGRFITRAEVEKARPARTTELLRRIAGIQLMPMAGGNDVRVRGTCRPSLFVDGVRVHGYRSIDDLAQPYEVEGIEVYRSADQAPVEFTGIQAGCAVVLLWTRID